MPMQAEGRRRYSSNPFATSVIEGMGGQSICPRHFNPRERPSNYCTGGWVASGPVWTRTKDFVSTEIRSLDIQILASLYTDYAIQSALVLRHIANLI
jgi:hypothetical protein